MDTKPEILMVGDVSQGGMSSVLKLYFDNGMCNGLVFLPSYKGGSFTYKIGYYIRFLFLYIRTLIRNSQIKLVHIHCSYGGSILRKGIAVYIAKLFHKKVVFHIHGSKFNRFYERSPVIVQKIISDILNRSDVIIALSRQWKADIAQKCQNRNIKVLYNPVKIREINHNWTNKINVLFMGKMGKRKGVYDIIEAAKHLNNRNIKINLYGDGEVEKVRDLVNSHKLTNIINVNGWISGDETEAAFKKADICILPSYNEGLPMFILEAMARGLPVISTHVGGIPESVKDGQSGFLIAPGDSKALAQKIELLANNPLLRQQIGQKAYKIAQDKFDVRIIISKLRGIYKELY